MAKKYEAPTQVKFFDSMEDGELTFLGGIAYDTKIICGCCGAVLDIEDVIADAEEAGLSEEEAIEELSWVSLTEEILGD